MMSGVIYFQFHCIIAILSLFGTLIQSEEMEQCKVLKTERSFDRTTGGVRLWPNGYIPYTVDSNFQDEHREIFNKALDNYHSKTCLRFEPKSPDDTDHIHMKLNFEMPYCGLAHLCPQGIGAQVVNISPGCSFLRTYVHEMGHSLCMDHEHLRVDRNDYLDYSECGNLQDIEKIEDRLPNRIQIYDYLSAQHYTCHGCNGIPSKKKERTCGRDVNLNGLSVIDADKVNEIYSCQGCHRHRWYKVNTLTSDQEASLVDFGSAGSPSYLCRGFVEGIGGIYPGHYKQSEKTCEVTAQTKLFTVTHDVQIFGLPNGPNVISNITTGYRFLPSVDKEASSSFIEIGMDDNNWEAVAAVREIEENDGEKKVLLGWSFKRVPGYAFFSHNGEQITVSQKIDEPIEYYTIGCTE